MKRSPFLIQQKSHIFLLICCILSLSACSSRTSFPDEHPRYQRGMIADIQKIPQDLEYFANILTDHIGKNTLLLSPVAQQEHFTRFKAAYFKPWQRTKSAYSLKSFKNTLGKAHGYNGTSPWTSAQWDGLIYSMSIHNYPNTQKKGIIIQQTSLREKPTFAPRFSKPTPNVAKNPFDNFQYSILPMGMPLYINHISRDGLWYFVESPRTFGWVHSKDVAFVDEAFIQAYSHKPLVALTKDKVQLTQTQKAKAPAQQVHMGTIFPLLRSDTNQYYVNIPVRGAGSYAKLGEASLTTRTASPMPMPMRAHSIAELGMEMMGQPYGWGGTNGYRDCSSTLHDLFTPFGIWLPRNSRAQYNAGIQTPLTNLSPEAKEARILQKASPFTSFLWMPGHIGLYVGQYQGKAVMFHNMWGIHVDEQNQGDNRFVIGRATITSLEPGDELKNALENKTLLTRINGISTIKGSR